MSRSISQMSRASSAGLSERLGSLGLTLDNTSVYSESGLPQSPSARSIASSRPPPSQSGYSKSGYPPRGPQSPINTPPSNSPTPGSGPGNPQRGSDFASNGSPSPFSGASPANPSNNGPTNERSAPPQAPPKPTQPEASAERKPTPSGPTRNEPTPAPAAPRGGSPPSSQDRPRTTEGPNAMPGMMHKPTIKLPSPPSSVRSPQTPALTSSLTQGAANGPARFQNASTSSNGSYKLAGSGYGPTGGNGGNGGYSSGPGQDKVMDIKVFTRPGSGGGSDDGMDHIGTAYGNSRVPSRGFGSVSRNVKVST